MPHRLADRLKTGRVPDPGLAIGVAHRQPGTIVIEREPGDGVLDCSGRSQRRGRSGIPEADLAVVVAGDKQRTVRTESKPANPSAYVHRRLDRLEAGAIEARTVPSRPATTSIVPEGLNASSKPVVARFGNLPLRDQSCGQGVPEPDNAVRAAGRDGLAIRARGKQSDLGRMGHRCADRRLFSQLPDSSDVVFAACQDRSPVGAESDRSYGGGVRERIGVVCKSHHIPDAGGVVVANGRQQRARGVKGDIPTCPRCSMFPLSGSRSGMRRFGTRCRSCRLRFGSRRG